MIKKRTHKLHATVEGRHRKKQATAVLDASNEVVMLELGKKGAGGIAKPGRSYVLANDSTLERFKGIRKTTRGQVDLRNCRMAYAGLEGNHIIRPPKPRQDDAKKKVPNDPQDATVQPNSGNRTNLPNK